MLNNTIVRSALALMMLAGAASAQHSPTTPTSPTTEPTHTAPATPATQPTTPEPTTTPAVTTEHTAATDEKLPTGKEVFAKFIDATGGRAAYEKLTSRTCEGTIEVKPLGVNGTVSLKQGVSKLLMKVDFADRGAVTQGNDGTYGWTTNNVEGARVLTGKEFDEILAQSQFAPELNPDTIYKSVECTAVETIDGAPCYRVETVTKNGAKRTNFYSKADGLLVKVAITMQTQRGEVQTTTRVSDYRDVDGVKVPFVATMTFSSSEALQQVMTFKTVTHNTTLAADTFTAPKEVQALIDASKSAGDTTKTTTTTTPSTTETPVKTSDATTPATTEEPK